MDKFLKICEKYSSLLEQEDVNQPTAVDQSSQPDQPQIEQNPESQERVASNEEIAKLIKSMQIFYSKDENKLTPTEIDTIKSLNPTNSNADVDIKKIISTLSNIFSPISEKPDEMVPDSSFEKNS